MIGNQYSFPLHHDLISDLFAGGGGASTGIEMALGRYVDIAINHDPEAISLHMANHPQTRHYCSDVFEVDPLVVCEGKPVGLLWASPDCKHFSKAKGGKPVEKKIRSLAWVVVKWAKLVRPRVICLENVEEFQTWGPLGPDNRPDPAHLGETFQRWVGELRRLGYAVEWRELVADHYGAPTSRKRLFLVARCDGNPIVWPARTHAPPGQGLKKWHTAGENLDFTLPCPSIFGRKRPLAENTLRRIAKGIKKFVIDNPKPFIVPINVGPDDFRGKSAEEPLTTITAKARHALVNPSIVSIANWSHDSIRDTASPLSTITANPKGGHHALIAPVIAQMGYGDRGQQNRTSTPDRPLWTICGEGNHAGLVAAFLAKYYGGVIGAPLDKPCPTITSIDHNSLVAAYISKLRGTNIGHGLDEPLQTISAQGTHFAEVCAFMTKYYGNDKDGIPLDEPLDTITTKDRFGLVTVNIEGEPYAIVDIGFRMLTPTELFACQGFPEHYHFDRGADGKPLTKKAQCRMVGNSVCPPLAEIIVRANYTEKESQPAGQTEQERKVA